MSQGQPKKKVANSLVAASSAAILAVYAAGYTRTRDAAQKLEAQTEERRPPAPGPVVRPVSPVVTPAAAVTASVRPVAPVAPVVPTVQPAAPVEKKTEPIATPAETSTPAPVVEHSEPVAPVAAAVAAPAAPPAPVTPAPEPAAAQPPPAIGSAWKDGKYLGWGTSRHGDIQAAVVIAGGRIVSATIADCRTRYSCSVIDRLPPEVAERQSPEVDYVSGATQSTNAFYYAVVDALSKAK